MPTNHEQPVSLVVPPGKKKRNRKIMGKGRRNVPFAKREVKARAPFRGGGLAEGTSNSIGKASLPDNLNLKQNGKKVILHDGSGNVKCRRKNHQPTPLNSKVQRYFTGKERGEGTVASTAWYLIQEELTGEKNTSLTTMCIRGFYEF